MSPEAHEIKGFKLLVGALTRAAADEKYRQELLENPRSVLEDAGLEVPAGVKLVVHENTSKEVHLTIPSRVINWDELEIDAVNLVLILECGF